MSHDFLTRVYLRQYAFLARRYPDRSPSALYHYATLAVGALLSLALLALAALGFWVAAQALQKPVAPWHAPNWVLVVESTVWVFVPGLFVDRKMKYLEVVPLGVIAFYSTPSERRRWWLTLLSILPLGAIVAASFGAIRASS